MFSRLLLLLAAVWQGKQAERCQYVLHNKQGVIKSPNYPNPYPNGIGCTWLIQSQDGYTITLKIKAFRLEGPSPDCDNDSLMIYDGPNVTANSFESPYCARSIQPTFISSENVMLIRFTSDGHRSFSGFKIEYNAEPNCNQSIFAENGTISSPRYPNEYYSNADCHWSIGTREGTTIKIEVIHFEMEDNQGGLEQCYDYLAFYDILDGHKKLIGKYCGKVIPPVIKSISNKMELLFFSDGTVTKKGFLITFSAQAATTPALNATSTDPSQTCTDAEFKCKNGLCLKVSLRCNQVNDCGDHSDETNCAGPCSDRNGGCEHSCKSHPVWQSYCTCNNGYRLMDDKKGCQDIDECSLSNGGCGDVCSNFIGGYKCECAQNGYQIGADGKTCQDINECLAKPCQHVCRNTIGSYYCQCDEGFRPTSSGRCVDKNECAIGVPSCFDCVNTIGSYRCNCDKGFRSVDNSTKCEDVDECNRGEACSQLCTNTYGSYHCHCRDGFQPYDASGKICVDVNECQKLQSQCEHMCINSPGSYACTCRSGFKLVNKTRCVNDDVCNHLSPKPCQYGCLSSGKSIRCTCPQGHVLSSNGRDCNKPFNQSDCGSVPSFTRPNDKFSTAKNAWSWQAYLQISFPYIKLQLTKPGCMATIISKYYLITTAHCLHLGKVPIAPSQLRIRLGFTKGKRENGKAWQVDEIIFYPGYNRKAAKRKNDIALIKLLEPISTSPSVQPVCMHPDFVMKDDDSAYIISWGRIDGKRYSTELRESRIKIHNSSRCSWLKGIEYDAAHMFCAGNFAPNKKICLADSGSPLMVESPTEKKWYLFGILVNGAEDLKPCSKKYKSNAFYDLSSYKQWIQEFVK